MAFDAYAEGGTDMLMSRAKLLEILDNLGASLPVDLKHIRREEQSQSEPSRPPLGHDTSHIDKWREAVEPGPSHANEHWSPSAGSTDFEAEWARLPPAITALPSFFKVKQLVMRNTTEKTKFRRSLPVLINGIDYCFLTRPTFRQILLDLDGENQGAEPDHAESVGLLPTPPDPLTLTEALWECHFGVPRHMVWYSALAEFPAGVASCRSIRFAPPNPGRLGLSRIAVDSPTDVVHCAVEGTKRPLSLVGPASGLLYAVTQGSLLVISWPSTVHNFDAWYRLSRSIQTNQFDHLDELEDPNINLLRTGDAVYLPAGTTNVMVALTHVSLTSRQILNPTSKELGAIARCCNRLMDIYVDQQNVGYSPFDEMEVARMDANVVLWTALIKHLSTGKLGKNKRPSYRSSARTPLQNLKPHTPALQEFVRGLRQIDERIEQYRKLVHESAKDCDGDEKGCSCGCSHSRPFETLNALAKLSTSADSGGSSAMTIPIESAPGSIRQFVRSGITIKGKDRAPS
ncbi:uncharacterized protein UTRI_10518_B [Ustilago trichophora]|uniref:Uncharacterized protein n=1 Tax=Ustilago trichophora TaxID=86804 RepID=A0A5C3EBW0_9BASI|nr:uncharacterized protein UTRI_10518_B [Ustilago trichophora]